MGKVEISIYFCVTADILTKILLKRFGSSPLPTIRILSKSLILATERLNFLACNIYSILAEYNLHSCTFRWALWSMGLWLEIGFCSITLIAFVWFCSKLHHTLPIRQCTFARKIGAEGSISRVMPHCNSYNEMFVLWLIVHTLWNQLLLEFSLDLFKTLQIYYRCMIDVHKEILILKKYFLINWKGF